MSIHMKIRTFAGSALLVTLGMAIATHCIALTCPSVENVINDRSNNSLIHEDQKWRYTDHSYISSEATTFDHVELQDRAKIADCFYTMGAAWGGNLIMLRLKKPHEDGVTSDEGVWDRQGCKKNCQFHF